MKRGQSHILGVVGPLCKSHIINYLRVKRPKDVLPNRDVAPIRLRDPLMTSLSENYLRT